MPCTTKHLDVFNQLLFFSQCFCRGSNLLVYVPMVWFQWLAITQGLQLASEKKYQTYKRTALRSSCCQTFQRIFVWSLVFVSKLQTLSKLAHSSSSVFETLRWTRFGTFKPFAPYRSSIAVARKTVERVLELQEKISIFLQEHNANFALLLADDIWLKKLAHFPDMLKLLN